MRELEETAPFLSNGGGNGMRNAKQKTAVKLSTVLAEKKKGDVVGGKEEERKRKKRGTAGWRARARAGAGERKTQTWAQTGGGGWEDSEQRERATVPVSGSEGGAGGALRELCGQRATRATGSSECRSSKQKRADHPDQAGPDQPGEARHGKARQGKAGPGSRLKHLRGGQAQGS